MGLALARRLIGHAVALATLALPVQADETFLGLPSWADKRPRIAGRFVTWTADPVPVQSWGRIQLADLESGVVQDLGPGFDPDITLMHPGMVGGSPVGGPSLPGSGGGSGALSPGGASLLQGAAPGVSTSLRLAWLRFSSSSQLDLVELLITPQGSQQTVLLSDLPWADGVRVDGPLTVFAAADGQGVPAVFALQGQGLMRLSSSAPAFRPDLARDGNGLPVVVWDEYVGGRGSFDYEVFLARGLQDGSFSKPVNVSLGPGIADLSASVAPDHAGGFWVSFSTNRGTARPWIMVVHLDVEGNRDLPAPFPPSSDPALAGIVDLKVHRATHDPELRVDAAGRLWLFTSERPQNSFAQTVYDKQLRYTILSGGAWSNPVLLSSQPRGDLDLDATIHGNGLQVVYQSNPGVNPAGPQVAVQVLHSSTPAVPPVLARPSVPPPPALHPGLPVLPQNRSLDIGGVPHRLLLCDLHSHSGRSPDAMGKLDHALFYARDLVGLDVWATVNHDSRDKDRFLDYEYELDRRLVGLLGGNGFLAFMGFEWTNNDANFVGTEDVGHRAAFDSPFLLRYTDAISNELGEFYGLMAAEGAIGVPHHLGKIGGATFLEFNNFVQPVTEVASVHGVYEDELNEKLLIDQRRFGVIASGDDHDAMPGRSGIAGVWVPEASVQDPEAFKQALRDHHTYALRFHGAHLDMTLQGATPGSEIVHTGDLLLQYDISELATSGSLNVSLVRNGEWAAPLYQRLFSAGQPMTDTLIVAGSSQPAFYMLRVTKGSGTAPKDTVLWSTPVWVDPPPGP